jgi:hypothetical protein
MGTVLATIFPSKDYSGTSSRVSVALARMLDTAQQLRESLARCAFSQLGLGAFERYVANTLLLLNS